MGLNSSKVIEGGILIELDKPYYYPGEMVLGKIYLNFHQNFSTYGIELGLEVEEFCSFKEQKRRKQNHLTQSQHNHNNIHNHNNNSNHVQSRLPEFYSKLRYGKRILFKSSQIIINFPNNMIYSGQYVYPFSFMLPPGLPGSFEYYDFDNTAYIKYILEAKVLSSNSNNHIKNEILIIVRQNPQHFQYPTRLSDTKNITTWCFFGKGTSTMNISYEKNYYCPEEKVNVICELDNTRCRLDASCIKLALIQTISLKDKKNRIKILSRKVAESRYDGSYAAGQENVRTLELILSDNRNPTRNSVDRCNHHYLFKDKSLVSMLQASVQSQLIECKYHFQVSTEYNSVLCCSGRPFIEIPIIMYIPDIRPNIQLYQPNNWNPTTMPILEINLPSYAEVISSNQNLNVEFSSKSGNMNVQTQQTKNDQVGINITMTNQTPAFQLNQGGMVNQNQAITTQPVVMNDQTKTI